MKKTLVLFTLLIFTLNTFCQKLEWLDAIGSTSFDYGRAVTYDQSGNTYATGTFHGTVDFNPGTNVFYLSSTGAVDIFITKFDSAGRLVWAKGIGPTCNLFYPSKVATIV